MRLFRIIPLIVFAANCSALITETEADLYEKNKDKAFSVTARSVLGNAYPGENAAPEKLTSLIQEILTGIREGDSAPLLNAVDPETGIYVDYDAHRTFSVFKKEMQDTGSFPYAVLFDSKKLKEITDDRGQKSIRHVLLKNRSVSLEIFLEGSGERAEVKFTADSTPGESFRFNNAVFIFKNDRWVIWQMF